ncbi:hypothetical protein, partial [Pseudomonas aeruginosa]|uniref:hypothetical protein n=1 Tax=Pseudomonas aeruginosa TaxID=287 RepID=UPI0038953833
LEIRHRSVRPISAKHAQASRFLQQSRVDLERLDLSVDQGHQSFLSQLNGVFQIDWENLNGVRQKCPIDLGHQ